MAGEASIGRTIRRAALALGAALLGAPAAAEPLSEARVAALLEPPYKLGESIGDGAWTIVDLAGENAGYVFETAPLAPLPGFAGEPINVLVTLGREGDFIDAELLSHNEPVFVSGLGEAPFHAFVAQYRGLSISDTITVGVPYGAPDAASGLVHLDGVTKATASVRIAHESILAASLAIARERMKGLGSGPSPSPDPSVNEALDWAALVEQGLATRRLVTNAEVQAAFADTLWETDDPEALGDPDAAYLDLWIVDLGPPAIARAALAPESYEELRRFLEISPHDEPILLIDAGRHGLVSEDFVRNTAPALIGAEQFGFPVALRDADLESRLAADAPEAEHWIVLRADRRLGFDPTQPWTLSVRSVRAHGSFRPELGAAEFAAEHRTPERFFLRPQAPAPASPAVEAFRARAADLAILAIGLAALGGVLATRMRRFAGTSRFTPLRLAILAVMTVFVGWWGQGQLSIVTVLGVLRAAAEARPLDFLLYDPFSLLIWAVVLVSFVVWGRGFFCGWLCPFGALQEFAHHAGRLLGLRQRRVPRRWDRRLKLLKYGVLAVLVAAAFLSSPLSDALVEVEPFKTAITVGFVREWPYVAYALLWLVLGLALFKPFCRYVCPLGAVMAIGGLLRGRDWIPRRAECGSPCRLCEARCKYQAIEPSGAIRYDECFQCLDCVTIYDDARQCVPLVLAARRAEQTRVAAE